MKRFARVRAIGDLCVPDNRDKLYGTNSHDRRRYLARRERPMAELEAMAKEAGLVDAKGKPMVGHLPVHERFAALPFVDVELTDAVAKICGVGRHKGRAPEAELLAQCEAGSLEQAKKKLSAAASTASHAPAPSLAKRPKKDGGDA